MAKGPNQRKNPSVSSEEELARQHERKLAVISAVKYVFMTAMIGGFTWACAYSMFYLPISVAHGKNTTINVAQQWLANVDASVYVAWGTAVGAGAYGVFERRKRNQERLEKDDRIAKLEKQIDAGRTSSGLTPGGELKR